MGLLCNLYFTIHQTHHFNFGKCRPVDCVIDISKLAVNIFTSFELDTLKKVYFFFYTNLGQGNVTCPESYQNCFEVICHKNRYVSSNSKNLRSSYIVAYWCKDGGEISKYNENGTKHLQV